MEAHVLTWQGGGYTLARGVHVYRTTPSDDFWSNVGVWMLPRVSLLFVLSDLGRLGVSPRTAQGVNHAQCRGAWQWPRISHEFLKQVFASRLSSRAVHGRQLTRLWMYVQGCWEHYLHEVAAR